MRGGRGEGGGAKRPRAAASGARQEWAELAGAEAEVGASVRPGNEWIADGGRLRVTIAEVAGSTHVYAGLLRCSVCRV